MFKLLIVGETAQDFRSKFMSVYNEFFREEAEQPLPKIQVEIPATIQEISRKLEAEDDEVPAMIQPPSLATVEAAQEAVHAPVAQVASGELDVRGLPWDKRIHAKTRTKNKDGSWKNLRGVDKDLLSQIEAELASTTRTQQPVQVAAPPPVFQEAPTQTELPSVPELPLAAPIAPAAPVLPVPAAIPVPQSGHTLETFKDQMIIVIANLVEEGKLTQEYVNQLKGHFGVDDLWALSDDQKEEMFNSFASHGLIQRAQ